MRMLRIDLLPIGTGWNGCYCMATGAGALGPGHPSDRCPLNPCQGRSQARLRVHMCQALLRSVLALRPETA